MASIVRLADNRPMQATPSHIVGDNSIGLTPIAGQFAELTDICILLIRLTSQNLTIRKMRAQYFPLKTAIYIMLNPIWWITFISNIY